MKGIGRVNIAPWLEGDYGSWRVRQPAAFIPVRKTNCGKIMAAATMTTKRAG